MDLSQIREKIDQIDDQIATLLCERLTCSQQVAQYKQENGIAFWNGRMFSRNHERIITMGEKEIKQRMANVSNEVLLEAITKLSAQNQQLGILIDKNSRSSTITSIITCVAGALLGTLFGFLLSLFT